MSERKSKVLGIDDPEDEDQKQDCGRKETSVMQDNQTVTEPTPKPENDGESIPSPGILAKSDSADSARNSLKRKKSVSFAEGTKTEDSKVSRKRQPNPIFAHLRSPPAMATAETLYNVQAKSPPEQMTSLLNAEANLMRYTPSQDSKSEINSPVIPEHESTEDAAMRQQMLQYNMQEVGAIVAEIDLDDDESTPPYSEDEDLDDYDDTSTEEEEDEYGRATNIIISEGYIQQMKALEKRLNASMLENIGPAKIPASSSLPGKENGPGGVADLSTDLPPNHKHQPTKGVRFAEKLEIQEVPTQNQVDENLQITRAGERPISQEPPNAESKVSRFKATRRMDSQSKDTVGQRSDSKSQQRSQPVAMDIVERSFPTGPPNRPHADIIERPFNPNPDVPPPEPDEFDPKLLERQVATVYHRHRSRMLNRQGGVPPNVEDDEADIPVDENGGGRKVSRFMASRLGMR